MKLSTTLCLFGAAHLLAACGGSAVSTGEDGREDPDGRGEWIQGDGDSGYWSGDGDSVEPGPPYGDGDGDGDGGGYAVGGGSTLGPPLIGISPGGQTPVDPGECTPEYGFSEGGYCEQQSTCENGGWMYTYCDGYDGRGECYCDVNGFALSLPSTGSAGDCETASELCREAVATAVLGETTCEENYNEEFEDEYCSASENCTTQIATSQGNAEMHSWNEAWCENWDGFTRCECYGGPNYTTVEFPENGTGAGLCSTLLDECQSGTAFDPSLPSTCSPRSLFAERTSCNVEIQCTQDKIVAGRPAYVSQMTQGYCNDLGNGTWDCACGFNGGFQIQGTSGWEVCSEAAERCAL